MEQKEAFEFSYSAKQQEEVEAIRKKYMPKVESEAEDKLEQLRKLDRRAEQKATMAAIVCGTIGTLVFGTGMSLVLAFEASMFLGILVGILGTVGIAAALPLYRVVLAKEREKIAPRILALSEELLK